MIYDLHTHSNASDGILSPEALVSRAKARGVTHLAVTDHDTVSGLHAARAQADREGIALINGIELSCSVAGRNVHLVGLNVDPEAPSLLAAVALQRDARDQRARDIGERLAKVGVVDAYAGARRLAGDEAAIGRPHFARYLIEQGHVSNINAAFKQYLAAGKVADVKHRWPELGDMVEAVLRAGGTPVLAHPAKYQLTQTKLRQLAQAFKDCGGQAIEVVSGQQPANEVAALADVAQRLDLHASCGSDFHVPDQPWQELGSFGTLPPQCRPVWQLWLH